MSINWVMLSPNGNPPFVALPHETILHTTNKSIALAIQSGKDLPNGDQRKKSINCPAGTAYLTNLRIVYLPEKLSSSAEFQNFAVPIKRVSDSHVTQPWFSANAFVATITPVPNGGIPHYAELKLVFKEGGAFEFYNTYTAILDRLHAQGGTEIVEHLEDLPQYTKGTEDVPHGEGSEPTESQDPPVPDDHDDLPPSYDQVASDEETRGRARVRR